MRSQNKLFARMIAICRYFAPLALTLVALGNAPFACGQNTQEETAARDCFDEPGIVLVIAQGFAQLAYRDAERSIELDERIAGPEPLAHAFPAHDFARVLEQHLQKSRKLLLQLDSNTLPQKLPGFRVRLEHSEAIDSVVCVRSAE